MSKFPSKCHFVCFWASMWETMELSQTSNDATFLQRKLALPSLWWLRNQEPPTAYPTRSWDDSQLGLCPCKGGCRLCWTISPSVQPPGVPILMWEAHQGPPTVPPQNWLTLWSFHSWISTPNSSLWSFLYSYFLSRFSCVLSGLVKWLSPPPLDKELYPGSLALKWLYPA